MGDFWIHLAVYVRRGFLKTIFLKCWGGGEGGGGGGGSKCTFTMTLLDLNSLEMSPFYGCVCILYLVHFLINSIKASFDFC